MWIVIGLLLITIAILIWLLLQKKELDHHTADMNLQIQRQNEVLKEKAENLTIENEKLEQQYETLKDLNSAINIDIKANDFKIAELNKQIDDKKEQLNYFDKLIDDNKEISQQAFSAYFDNLEEQYNKIEDDFDLKVKKLQNHIQQEVNELEKLKATRAAAHEAMLREQEVKDNKDAYQIHLSELEKRDIRILNSIKKELINERPVNMIIWQTYYSKKANDLCVRILGTKQKTGIYKITQLSTDRCYIGQAKDIKERLREHMKCGLGIDTPVGNKLYKAMLETSLDDFIFEIVEECKDDVLNEKEKYYIDLFQSYDYGFNSNRGIEK